ncbi:MAG: aminotransferase class I/II-fold pyridoxal phosphate-dependent enzyme [Nannocystaceae bacterium]
MTTREVRELLMNLATRLEEWQRLRREGAPLPSLAGLDLAGADLSGIELADTDLRRTNFQGAVLRGTSLRNCDLRGARLGHADLVDTDFDLAQLGHADLSQAQMPGQNLSGMDLRGADLRGTNLRLAYLGYARLQDAKLADADLTGADLSGAALSREQLDSARTDADTRYPRHLTRPPVSPRAPAEPADLVPRPPPPPARSVDVPKGEKPRSFLSDNASGLCREALEAIVSANDRTHATAYGDDHHTLAARATFQDLLGHNASVWFVGTGTAANTLAIAALTEPWQIVLSHTTSHLSRDESTAPEWITRCRTAVTETLPDKLVPDDLGLLASRRTDVHQPQPGVVTLSNPTEYGTVYTPEEMRALCDRAHAEGFRVHVDGARFANAVSALGCSARDLTCHAGVDALSFGGTKNGLAVGEAVVFFRQGDPETYQRATQRFPFLRKATGHLISKQRFVSAPFSATLATGAWLRHASHANAMARKLARGLTKCGYSPRFPTSTNAVFVELPAEIDTALRNAGHHYYRVGEKAELCRLTCSFDTSPEEVDAFLEIVRLTPT